MRSESAVQDDNIHRKTFKYDHYCGHSVMFPEFISSATIFELQLPTAKFTVSQFFFLKGAKIMYFFAGKIQKNSKLCIIGFSLNSGINSGN